METRKGGRLVDRPEFKTKPQPVTFLGKDKVSVAIEVMAEKNYGSVVVVDNKDKVVGIVTERDIVKKLVKNNMPPKTTKLEDIMTPNPRVANENDDVVDWLRIMSNDRFRRLPVVDANGKIKTCAIVTTASNSKLSKIHHRLPLVLERSDWGFWLGEEGHGASCLMMPTANDILTAYKVSNNINSNMSSGPDLMSPV